MRSLHLTLTTARGGRRDAILTLIGNLRELGVTVGLAGLRDTPGEVALLHDRLDFHAGLAIRGRPTAAAMANLWRLCREQRVDLLHVHDAGSQTVASALRCVLPKLRVVMTFHRSLGFDSEGWRNRVRNRVTLPAVAKVITASEERRRYFLSQTGLPTDRVTVIPHGVEFSQFHPETRARSTVRRELGLGSEAVVIVAVGHFGEEKGLDQVVAGVADACARIPEAPIHLAILGKGTPPQEEALRDQVAHLLGERATFLGFRTDVARWLQGADMLVHAPRLEAFGLVTVQAMACGLPVVATAVGGLPEIVADGVSGRLVALGAPAELGEAIATLAASEELRARLGQGALARAQTRFDARESARRHLALYQAVLP